MLGDVAEIEGADGDLLELVAFGAGVCGDVDGVVGAGFPEAVGEVAEDAECLVEGDFFEVDGDAPGNEVGVNEDVESGGVADGLVEDAAELGDVEGDGLIGDGVEVDGWCRALEVVGVGGAVGMGWVVVAVGFVEIGFDVLNVLLGAGVGGIDVEGLEEFDEGLFGSMGFLHGFAELDVACGDGGFHAGYGDFEAEVGGVFLEGGEVVFVGGFEIFAGLGGLGAGVQLLGGFRVGEGSDEGKEE